jgi:hypothetical protein
MKQYLLYLLRWQLSTPILMIILKILDTNIITKTIIANLIGGMIFYWVDKKILVRGKDERQRKRNKIFIIFKK